jgi:uncharacterized protein YcaQ
MERLFGMKYSIEMYLPPAKRVYGYYVCPFLLGDTLVARCDLKADRPRKMLMVQSAYLESGQNARRVVPDLVSELQRMQVWLTLDGIEVSERGDLAAELSGSAIRAAVPSKKQSARLKLGQQETHPALRLGGATWPPAPARAKKRNHQN